MKCPSEVELNEFAEDRLATRRRWEVEQHLQDCPGCRTDLEGLAWATAALDRLLEEVIAEASHPGPEDLAALREGKLAPPQRAEVFTHLSVCAECASLYGQLPQEQRTLPLARHWQPFAAAAAFLIIIGFIFFVARDQFTTGRAPMTAIERHAMAPTTAPPPVGVAQPGAASAPAAAGSPTASKPETAKTVAPEKTTTPAAAAGGNTVAPTAPPPAETAAAGHQQPSVTPPAPTPQPTRVAADSIAPAATHPREGSAPVAPSVSKGISGPKGAGGRMGIMSVGATRGTSERVAAVPPPGALKSAPPATPNALTPQQMLSQKAKNWPIGQQAVAPAMPGVPAGPAPATAAAPGAAPAGMGGGGGTQATAPMALANRLLLDRAWLLAVRNDPQRKAQIKAILERELKREKSGSRRELIRAALRVLDSPSPRQRAAA